MTPRKRHSSRKRMESRLKRRLSPSPTVIKLPDGKGHMLANRMAKRQHVSTQAHAAGTSARQEQEQKRKDNRKAAARVLRKMRKETQQAMRKAAGL